MIIVNGDIVAHDHAAEATDNSSVIETKWNSSKDIMNIVFFMMRSQYPDQLILPTIGNNDVKIHNQVPCSAEEATSYYGDMLELFFPATYTPTGMNRTAVNETFLKGGYYSYKIPNTDLTFIGLNTMYYKDEDNKCSYAFEIGDE